MARCHFISEILGIVCTLSSAAKTCAGLIGGLFVSVANLMQMTICRTAHPFSLISIGQLGHHNQLLHPLLQSTHVPVSNSDYWVKLRCARCKQPVASYYAYMSVYHRESSIGEQLSVPSISAHHAYRRDYAKVIYYSVAMASQKL